MFYHQKHFTLAEARRELPFLRQAFLRVQELLEELRGAEMEMARVEKLIRSNGHGSQHPDFGKQIHELQELVAAITDKGIEIKDLSRGLVDFPHLRRGEEVYLCWLYGEDDIEYWHTINAGFQGRTQID